jgi:hypothetical protein
MSYGPLTFGANSAASTSPAKSNHPQATAAAFQTMVALADHFMLDSVPEIAIFNAASNRPILHHHHLVVLI